MMKLPRVSALWSLSLLLVGAMFAPGPAAAGGWEYSTNIDKMTSKKTVHAVIRSSNSLSLQFPYRGANFGRLVVGQHPKYGTDVIVDVDKGQILCRSYDGCSISVRFDSAKPSTFSATPPADHSADHVFFENAQRFIASARKAKRILVQLTFFQSGTQVLEFEVDEPLRWPPKN